MKQYISTNLYNWEVLRDNTYILWARKTSSDGHFNGEFLQFSYYQNGNDMLLDQSVHIHCESFDDKFFRI